MKPMSHRACCLTAFLFVIGIPLVAQLPSSDPTASDPPLALRADNTLLMAYPLATPDAREMRLAPPNSLPAIPVGDLPLGIREEGLLNTRYQVRGAHAPQAIGRPWKKFAVLTIAMVAASAADMEMSHYVLSRYPSIELGCRGIQDYRAQAIFNFAWVVTSYHYIHDFDRPAEHWWLPQVLSISAHMIGVASGLRALEKGRHHPEYRTPIVTDSNAP